MQVDEEISMAVAEKRSLERSFISWALAQETFTDDLRKVTLSVILNSVESSLPVRQRALKLLMGA